MLLGGRYEKLKIGTWHDVDNVGATVHHLFKEWNDLHNPNRNHLDDPNRNNFYHYRWDNRDYENWYDFNHPNASSNHSEFFPRQNRGD